jgi:rod shape-determining protein MreC
MKSQISSIKFRRLKKIIVVFVLIVILFFVVGVMFNSSNFLSNKAVVVLSFIQSPLFQLNSKITGFLGFIFSLQAVNNENISLKNENLRLLSEAAQVFELKNENNFLRASLDLEPKQPLRFTVARVVGQEFSGVSNIIIINKGISDGIKEGMAVVLTERILVGLVIEVKDDLAYVRLLTDPQMNLAAITLETQTEGILRGDFGHTLILDEIIKDNLIFLGELVLSSGKDGRFPANFVAGRVRDIRFSESGLFKQAVVEPIIDLDKVYQVLVVLGS